MHKILSFLFLGGFLFSACRSSVPPESVPDQQPTAVAVTDATGATQATQPGPLWILVSGVDEHGLIAEHEVTLLSAPDAAADPGPVVHTGVPAAVYEIRQAGPQSLQRFYRIKTTTGAAGWVSDYYVRRIAYLYNPDAATVPIYASPNGQEVGRLPNVSPVLIKEPSRSDWWLIQGVEDNILGWVEAGTVKESADRQFLTNEQHDH
ncbi:MAG: hypothetical protein ACE5FD_12370 [Anaerolineae bacterium]